MYKYIRLRIRQEKGERRGREVKEEAVKAQVNIDMLHEVALFGVGGKKNKYKNKDKLDMVLKRLYVHKNVNSNQSFVDLAQNSF